jgi:hypothetical protein
MDGTPVDPEVSVMIELLDGMKAFPAAELDAAKARVAG